MFQLQACQVGILYVEPCIAALAGTLAVEEVVTHLHAEVHSASALTAYGMLVVVAGIQFYVGEIAAHGGLVVKFRQTDVVPAVEQFGIKFHGVVQQVVVRE